MRSQPDHRRSHRAERLWTVEQTADYLGVPVSTLYQWRYQRKGPKAYKVGRWLRYDPAAIHEWLDQHST